MTIYGNKMIEIIERQELIQKLVDNGYGEFVELMLTNETKAFTRKGRINKSGSARVLNLKNKQLEEILRHCREILKEDIPSD